MAEVIFQDVCKDYGDVRAVDRMNLRVKDKEFFVILGPSGAGKTTTLKMVAGIEPVSGGTISFNGKSVNEVSPDRRNIAMVFESYALYSHLSVYENISFPLYAPGRKKLTKTEVVACVKRIAGLLGIETLLDRKPSELSGGQRQRVALGRVLVREPEVFLMDEPLSHLDAKIRHRMRGELKHLKESINTTIIYVTHDYSEAMSLGDRMAVINNGIIQQVGTPDEVYNAPANRFVAESLGDPQMNFLSGEIVDSHDAVRFKCVDYECSVPINSEMKQKLKSYTGKTVTVGIRPYHIAPSGKQTGDWHICGTVFDHEILGDESILSVSYGENMLMILTEPEMLFSAEETVFLTWEPEAMYFFSPETGINLLI